MPKQIVKMKLERETKRAYRYEEVSEANNRTFALR